MTSQFSHRRPGRHHTLRVSTAIVWRRRMVALPVVLGTLLAISACNFDVTNPGPTQDEFLNDTAAFTAQVNGIALALGDAMNYTALQGAIVARELFPTGMTGQFGIEPHNMFGELVSDEQGTPWSSGQQARWLAAQALTRFQTVLGDQAFASSPAVARAQLWQGYANRFMGENMCQSIIDGGAPTPSSDYLDVAEGAFTAAIATAQAASLPEVVTAALAGRASVRVDLGDWEGALTDAAEVPDDFVFQMPYFDIGDEYGYNRVFWSSTSASFYKGTSVWGTVYRTYYREWDDPRVAWDSTGLVGIGAVTGVGEIPWYPQMKYTEKTSGINLATGREMRLIEAEAALREHRPDDAMGIINGLRGDVGVAAWPAPANEAEAWADLKRERGVELWLEARRLNDLRRWKADGTPGDLDPLEVPGAASHLTSQDLCFPFSRGEIDTNPNIPQG
jgi:hypothetical protein